MTQAAGKLNHRIRLESLETSHDANGETVETWTHQGDVWAEVAPVSAKEFVSSAAMQSRIVARVTVRYRADIQATWRILFRGRYYNIEGVLTDVVSGLEYLTLPCSLGILAPDEMPWETTLLAVRRFFQQNYGEPNPHNQTVMPVPPVVTTSTAAETVTYSVVRECADPAVVASTLLIESGKPTVAATVFQQPYQATQNASTTVRVASRISVNVNADAVAFYVIGTPLAYRFLVDDRYVSFTGTVPAATTGTGNNYIILTFASKDVRKVTIELQQNCAVRRIAIKPADSFLAKPSAKDMRGIVLGDSITAATGATAFGDGFVPVFGDTIGMFDMWPSGVGSTGYVNTFGGTRFKLSERLGDANTTGPWDVLVVAMGINDVGLSSAAITAEVSLCLNRLRGANQGSQIFVAGPWDAAAPSAPNASYLACKQAIIDGIPADLGITFLDPQGVAYAKVDAVHPTTAGHRTLGDWLSLAVKTSIIG